MIDLDELLRLREAATPGTACNVVTELVGWIRELESQLREGELA